MPMNLTRVSTLPFELDFLTFKGSFASFPSFSWTNRYLNLGNNYQGIKLCSKASP